MRQFRTPLLGLILAVFFGVRMGNPSQAAESLKTASRAVNAKSPPNAKGKTAAKSASAAGRVAPAKNNCPASSSDPAAPGTRQEPCIAPLPQHWKALCALNPDHHTEEDFPASVPARDKAGDQFARQCLGSEWGKVLFVFASVPDPIHTHLGMMFDRALDAIQVAAAQDNFLPYSHYLPWNVPGSGDNSSEGEAAAASSNPGLLIFRRAEPRKAGNSSNNQRPDYLVVFLVTEVPTRGLDREAFLTARNVMSVLAPDHKKIWLAGPSFSGSVSSLADLVDYLDPDECIQAFSGSVTNPPNLFPIDTGPCKSQLHLFQTKVRQAMKEFVAGIKDFGYAPEQIALLSEEGTKYGNLGSPAEPETPRPGGLPVKDRALGGILLFSFPREISKLRNAYAEESNPPSNDQKAQGLPMQWQDAKGIATDDLPDYGAQTPNSQQAVLANISTSLRVHGIKVVGIIATNPLDTAFLLRQLKQSAQDVRFVLRDPDLLYLRTPDIGLLNGTLLLSNYPLIPQNQDWSSGEDEKDSPDGSSEPDTDHLITFASATQEGEYNAFVEMLRAVTGQTKDFHLLEWNWPSGHPISSRSRVEKGGGSPCLTQDGPENDPTPPLWLATIGTAGHYPLKVLCQNLNDIEPELNLESLPVGKPLYTPWLFWLMITAVGMAHLCGLVFYKSLPGRYKSDFELNDGSKVGPLKGVCHLVAILCIALAQWVLGCSYVFFRNSVHGQSDGSFAYPMLFWLVLVVTGILLGASGFIYFRIYTKKLALRMLFPVVIFLGAGIWWSFWVLPRTLQNAFLHFRDLNLTSGVAPVLPLAFLILVFYLGIWAFLRRLAYWQYRYAGFRALVLDEFVNSDFSKSAEDIDRCIQGRFKNLTWTKAFWATFLCCLLMYRPWLFPMDMLEPSGVRYLVTVFLCLVLLALWMNWFRFLSIWMSLQEILNRLETLPIKNGFSRLPHESSLPIWQWRSSDSCFLLRQVVDRLRALENLNPTLAADRVTNFNKWITEQKNLDVVDERLKEAKVKDLVEELIPWLKTNYWSQGSPGNALEKTVASGEKKNQGYEIAEDIVVLPFYDYIRHVVVELRNLLFFVVAAFCLLFGALHVYAFGADSAIDWSMIALFVVLGTGVVTVLAQMERNPLLQRLSDVAKGGLGKGFYIDLLKYGTVPLLTVLGSQVPFISNNVLRWLQPAVEALR